jgi:hypothetical protein
VLSVYSGRQVLGFILNRGPASVEAFTADERSIGVFPDQKSAADAVSAAALERECDDDEIMNTSSANWPFVLARQARRER